jgi:hypothetical protein
MPGDGLLRPDWNCVRARSRLACPEWPASCGTRVREPRELDHDLLVVVLGEQRQRHRIAKYTITCGGNFPPERLASAPAPRCGIDHVTRHRPRQHTQRDQIRQRCTAPAWDDTMITGHRRPVATHSHPNRAATSSCAVTGPRSLLRSSRPGPPFLGDQVKGHTKRHDLGAQGRGRSPAQVCLSARRRRHPGQPIAQVKRGCLGQSGVAGWNASRPFCLAHRHVTLRAVPLRARRRPWLVRANPS